MMDQLIGHVLFVDGVKRLVYQQPNGRQYVMDDEGEPVYGVWMLQDDDEVVPDMVLERTKPD